VIQPNEIYDSVWCISPCCFIDLLKLDFGLVTSKGLASRLASMTAATNICDAFLALLFLLGERIFAVGGVKMREKSSLVLLSLIVGT